MYKKILSLFKRNQKDTSSSERVMNTFWVKYSNFKDLLESNSELLKLISEMDEKLRGQDAFDMTYIHSHSARMIFHTGKMIMSYENLSGRKYPLLWESLSTIQRIMREEVGSKQGMPKIPDYVLPHSKITKELIYSVGGKNANLGETLNRVGLPIPGGFAVTTTAFYRFIEFNNLADQIRKQKMKLDLSDPESIMITSRAIQKLFFDSTIPPDVKEAISNSYEQQFVSKNKKAPVYIAIRSSALGEDSELSFAGQYLTVLNVPKDRLFDEYKRVLASLFSERGLTYRLRMGFGFEDAAMAVACLEMIPAKTSGVMYTRHPYNVFEKHIIINAVWGLGPYAVDGVVPPDTFTLSNDHPPKILDSKISEKRVKLAAKPDGYVSEQPLDIEKLNQPCLTNEQAISLAVYGMKLENHFQCPQDIEWAIDEQDRIVILQARPLRLEYAASVDCSQHVPRLSQYPILIEGGNVSCPGAGFGTAYHVNSDADLASFPEGGVLIAHHSSPKYVIVMQKAQAIVTESGSITGHMASLTREFLIPSILNVTHAMDDIPNGAEITVDAYSGRIYQGKVPELLEMKIHREAFMKNMPVYKAMRRIADWVIPLNLTDPKSDQFTAANCKTIHDIMRLIHEFSYTELFQISDLASDHSKISYKLTAPIPIDLYIIDIGGGLSNLEEHTASVTRNHVVSVPFKAVLKGMLREDLRSIEPRPVEIRGFLSVMSQQMLSPPNTGIERFGDKSYAIISDRYLNFSSRVGYHYSILDTYCGNTVTKNYINFEFKGGAADSIRRNRRARLIRKLLEEMNFRVEVHADRVVARFAKHESEVITEKLDYLGRLLMFTRQMDMLMHSEDSIERAAACFLKGEYQLKGFHHN